jgi:hypothetical protein
VGEGVQRGLREKMGIATLSFSFSILKMGW